MTPWRSAPTTCTCPAGGPLLCWPLYCSVSAPLAQRIGAGLAQSQPAVRRCCGHRCVVVAYAAEEARLQPADIPRLLAMAGFGASLGPWPRPSPATHQRDERIAHASLEALFTATPHGGCTAKPWIDVSGRPCFCCWRAVCPLCWTRDCKGAQLLGFAVTVATIAWGVNRLVPKPG